MKVSELTSKEDAEKARNTGKQLAALMLGKKKVKALKPQFTFKFTEFVNK